MLALSAAAPLRAESGNAAACPAGLPRTIETGPQGKFHVQGIAVDTEKGYIYFSFTTKLIKMDLAGNLIGSVGGMVGHLGCITFNPDDGCVYGSLEYKNDDIGKGIRNQLAQEGNNNGGNGNTTGFYAAVFDTDRITRPDMDAEKDKVMTAVFIKEAYDDHTAVTENNGRTLKHRLGCSGIDGTTIAPGFGAEEKDKHIYLAYGVYDDTLRTDNDYQVLLAYNLDSLKHYARPLTQGSLHRSGPQKPAHKYFVRTGNTSYGVQNLAYDRASGNFYMAVYKGRKKDFPNYSLFVADGSANPQKEPLQGFNPEREGEVIPLLKAGKCSKGIYGWDFNLGACGLCPLGDGYFYIAHNRKGKDGQQSCTARLYKWTGNDDNPFEPVK